ncbi:ATP phosphoribosyltransferase regulatory subunit [Thalassococcus sp. BH17M4-6]|uniref:ATP phosphoribosyltransferase regulatory subunit n=1 Tax=Thalassococcus sp. BH17M4-6 TaxID=3413148 RepID=UPI003BBB6CB7
MQDEAARLRAAFEAAGAQAVDCAILQPAETLLDLYGEDIRARAYVTQDPSRGEQMLRPDFTVPVVQMHMRGGAEPARYTYAGAVFRRQEDHPERASEYLQVGYEVFDRRDPQAADAEVFALFRDVLGGHDLRAATGDIGILTAAVQGLKTSARRRAALMRHIWRPRRFRQLIDRFAGRTAMPPTRAALLAEGDPMANAAPVIGLRGEAEIAARVAALREDAAEPPLSEGQVALIDAVLAVRETCAYALDHLRDIAVDLPAIHSAVERFARRCDALSARGVDVGTLDFEASYGRTSMEYYDGFVFGFYAEAQPDLPPVATGGRYDALTRQLGQGASIPAVGGVIRPDILRMLGGAVR